MFGGQRGGLIFWRLARHEYVSLKNVGNKLTRCARERLGPADQVRLTDLGGIGRAYTLRGHRKSMLKRVHEENASWTCISAPVFT